MAARAPSPNAGQVRRAERADLAEALHAVARRDPDDRARQAVDHPPRRHDVVAVGVGQLVAEDVDALDRRRCRLRHAVLPRSARGSIPAGRTVSCAGRARFGAPCQAMPGIVGRWAARPIASPRSAISMRAAASSSPIRGMSAAPGPSCGSGSRRSRRPARGSPGRSAGQTTRSASTRCWPTFAPSPRASRCRSTPISKVASRSSPRASRPT